MASRTRKYLALDGRGSLVAKEARRWLDEALSPMRYEGVATIDDGRIHVYRLTGHAGVGLLAESWTQLDDQPGVYRTRTSAWVLRRSGRRAFALEVELHSWDAGTEASQTGDRRWLEVPKRQLYAERDRSSSLVADELDRSMIRELTVSEVPDLAAGLSSERVRALAERYVPELLRGVDSSDGRPAAERRLSWPSFERRLARALAAMPPETFLILSTPSAPGPAYYVQFAHGTDVFRAEAVGSGNLPPDAPLRSEQTARIAELGWAFPETDSTNRNAFRDYPVPPPAAEIAGLAVETLRSVYGIGSPEELTWKAAAFDGPPPRLPSLGIEGGVERPSSPTSPAARRTPKPSARLRDGVERALAAWLGTDRVHADPDGDYPIRSGSTLFYVRLMSGLPPAVAVFAPILHEVAITADLLRALDDINARIRFGRVFTNGPTVIVALELPAIDLTPAHIAFACNELGGLADHLDDVLHGRFGGKLAFDSSPKLMN